MKRIFATLLALCLLLSLAACGGDEPGKTTTTQNPLAAMAGKYLVYHVNTGETELDYFQVRMSSYFADMYFDLRADGTAAGNFMGNELPEGATWDPNGLTNAEGDVVPLSIENNEMKLEINGGVITLLKEGDPRLDEELPNMFTYLYDHIKANGTQDERGYTVLAEEMASQYGYKITMTATADGKIFWNFVGYDGMPMEMEFVENAQFQTATMLYKGYSQDYVCTATIETATATYSDFQLSSFVMEPEYSNSETIQSIMTSKISILFKAIHSYVQNTVGISMPALGFTNYVM